MTNLELHAHFADSKCPILHQTNQTGPARTGMGERAKAKEQNPFFEFDTPKIKPGNPSMDFVGSLPFQNLKIQPDKTDKQAPEVSTMPLPPLEQGVVETAPKDSISKIDMIPKEQDEMVAQELRMQIEEAKYKLYISQLSTEKSDMGTEMYGSNYPFLD